MDHQGKNILKHFTIRLDKTQRNEKTSIKKINSFQLCYSLFMIIIYI
jgi:hypothetical protein